MPQSTKSLIVISTHFSFSPEVLGPWGFVTFLEKQKETAPPLITRGAVRVSVMEGLFFFFFCEQYLLSSCQGVFLDGIVSKGLVSRFCEDGFLLGRLPGVRLML